MIITSFKISVVIIFKRGKKTGRTRIRTGVVRIKTESDNHYTIQPDRCQGSATTIQEGAESLNIVFIN